VQERIDQLTK
jgi:hypothetical protein